MGLPVGYNHMILVMTVFRMTFRLPMLTVPVMSVLRITFRLPMFRLPVPMRTANGESFAGAVMMSSGSLGSG